MTRASLPVDWDRFAGRCVRRGPHEVWTGATSRGYPVASINGRVRKLHRYRVELELGIDLPPSVVVRHVCDRRTCVARACLLPGTQRQNIDDAVARGRFVRGERHHRARLTRALVRKIRRGAARGETNSRRLAHEYAVAPSTIRDVIWGKTWAWVR